MLSLMRMKIMKKIAVFVFFLVAPMVTPLVSQSRLVSGAPPAAASGPAFEVSAGYTYLDMDMPSRPRVGLSGVDANGFIDFNARWGIVVDASYARAGNVLGTPHNGNVLSLLTGPVF